MSIQSRLIKAAFLVPYLILVVMFPCTRGERLQKYHFFQFIESYQTGPLYDFPVVDKLSLHNHQHLSLFFYPAKGTPKLCDYVLTTLSRMFHATGLSVMATDGLKVRSDHSPPLCYSKTVSDLSPPRCSDV